MWKKLISSFEIQFNKSELDQIWDQITENSL